MPLLIDGHNLIPRVPGLSLQMVDDELALIERLQQYAARKGRRIEVYFDLAPAGSSGSRTYGRVTAIFVRSDRTADRAIRARLAGLGRVAANWTVVSSDHEVQVAARAAGARVLSSDDFARELVQGPAAEDPDEKPRSGPDELGEWLDLFGSED